jgi:hypothetical protein
MDKSDISFGFGVLVVIAAITCLIYMLESATCSNKAGIMEMKHSYGMLQGCMIEHRPGKWVPLKNYRVL